MQHYIFSHVPLFGHASASHDDNSVINGTIAFSGHDNQYEVQHDFFGHVIPMALETTTHGTDSVINGTIAFLESRKSKLECSMTFLVI